MNGIVIYWSQTGNTKKVAYAVQKGMSKLLDRCDIASIIKGLEVNPFDLVKYDVIGLGSAVVWAPPENVRVLIENLPSSLRGKHIFAFCTHGTYPFDFLPRVARLLTRKGLIVLGTKDWFGAGYLPTFPKPYFTDGHPDDLDLKQAEDFGEEMVELSRRISAGETNLIPPLPELFRPLPKWPPIVTGKSGKQFTYHKEKCNYPKCTLCIDNCPWDAINLDASPPYICKNGGICTWCEKICPTGAIEADYESRLPPHREMLQNLMLPSIDRMEATGRFRRLVPKEKVGWDTPYFKVASKHPREKVLKDKPG